VKARAIAASLAATAVLLALAVPAGAPAAKPHRVTEPAATYSELEGRGSHGFRFTLWTGVPRETTSLWFTKGNPLRGFQDVLYYRRPHGGRSRSAVGRMNVRVGPLGHFRGHFVTTSTETQKPERGCTGDPTKVEKGYFVGSFVFHDERGYTTVDARRERGQITRRGATSCPAPKFGRHLRFRPKHESRQERGEFRLVALKDHVYVHAIRSERPGGPLGTQVQFQASFSGEKVGGFEIDRDAATFAEESPVASESGLPEVAAIFRTPDPTEPLTEAIIEPPAPFSGSGTFHLDDPKTASWTGDLAVNLPGYGTLPLTGTGFDAGVCQGRHCSETLPKWMQPLVEAPEGVIVAVRRPKKQR
jgi:hypothetical protein